MQSNIQFGAVPPANVPAPSVGYLAVFIADGSAGTVNGVLYRKDSTGTVSALQDRTGDFTNARAQDAVGGALQSTDTVTLTYNTGGRYFTANVVPNSITTTHIADGGIQGVDLADAIIIPAKLADQAVQTAKLTDLAVSTIKIADLAVTTTKIADTAVTNTKMAAMAQGTFKMRAAGTGTGQPIDGSAAQVKTALAIQASDVSGLGSAATANTTAFDAAGAAAAAQAASQPLDSDLTAIAALITTSYGRALLTLADATANTALLNQATTTLPGLMSAADKAKLNNTSVGVYSAPANGITTTNTAAVNLAAWNTLMASIPDNSTVSFPPSPSPYQFSDTLVIPTGKHLRVQGGGQQKTIIQTTNPATDIISCGDWYQEFRYLKFTSSVTRTAGAAINSGNNVAINVIGCDFAGMWDGIVYTGGVNAGNLALVSACNFTATLNRGIVLDGTNANTIIENVVMDGVVGVQQVGLELLQCGSVLVSDSDFIRSVNNLRFNPAGSNGVFSAYFINTFFDTAAGSSVKFTNTGNIQRVKFTNCWFSGSVIGCEFASTATTLPTAIDFINCDIFGNSGRGIYANGVQDFNVLNTRIAGNTTAGIETNASAGSVTKFNLANNSICPTAGFGANGTGILINAGTYGGYAIKDNDLRNNTNFNLSDNGIVATTDLKIINDNFGHIIVGSIGNLAATASGTATTATALLTVRVPAKAATTGQVFRYRLLGNATASTTVVFRVHAGTAGTVADGTTWTSTTSATIVANNRAGFEGLLTVRTPGATGTVQAEALGFANTALLPGTTAAPGTITVNTTTAWFITLSVTVSAGGGFTAQQAVVEAL